METLTQSERYGYEWSKYNIHYSMLCREIHFAVVCSGDEEFNFIQNVYEYRYPARTSYVIQYGGGQRLVCALCRTTMN